MKVMHLLNFLELSIDPEIYNRHYKARPVRL
jgi:hypothetical protein